MLRDGVLRLEEVEPPRPGAAEVLIRSRACGICGSDLHFAEHGPRVLEASRASGQPSETDLSEVIVLGHELAGEIVEHGPGCDARLPVGARVCPIPFGLRDGVPHIIGFSNHFPGGYGELVVAPEAALLPLPDGLDIRLAALTEPMAVGLHAVEQAELTAARDTVALVIGCGPIGLAVLLCLRARGVRHIVASDPSAARRELAERLGADTVVDPGSEPPFPAWIESATKPELEPGPFPGMPDLPAFHPAVVFECVGVPGILQQILVGTLPRTRVVVVGACMEPDTIEPILAINKQIELRFVLGYTAEEFARTLGMLADGTLDPRPMITGTVGRDGVAEAFEALRRPENHAKVLVEPWRQGQLEPV